MIESFKSQQVTLVEGQIYLFRGSGHVTAELMHQFDQEFIRVIEASDAPLVHLIWDTRYILSLPSVSETRKLKYPYHPRMGYSLTIGAVHKPVIHFIINLSVSRTRLRYKDMNSLAEACAYLVMRDQALPPLTTWSIPSHADGSAS